jgi:hypothetical protein
LLPFALVALASATAHAQPAPDPDAAADSSASAPTSSSASTPAPYVSHVGETLPRGSWPGVSLEDLRAMRECTLDDPAEVVGQPIHCRPPLLPTHLHLGVDASWLTGLYRDGGDLRGVNGVAADAETWLTPSIGLGARYALIAMATATPARGPALTAVTHEALAELHVRLFTDEVDRDGVRLTLGGGYALRDARLGGDSPVARVAVSRDVGYTIGEHDAVTWAWELAVEQALGASTITTVTAGVRAGFELGLHPPGNVDQPDPPAPFRYSLGGEVRFSSSIGVGAALALPLTPMLSARATTFWTTNHDDGGVHGLLATWGLLVGPRLRLLPRSDFTPYVDLQGGVAAIGGDPTARLGTLAEAEGGLDLHVTCETQVQFGGRLQVELDGVTQLRTGFFIIRVEHGPANRRGACPKETPTAQY